MHMTNDDKIDYKTQTVHFIDEPSWVEFTVDAIRFTNERKSIYVEYEGDYLNPMPETITFILKGETFKYVKA